MLLYFEIRTPQRQKFAILDAKICNFARCEIRGGMGEISESVHVFRQIVYAPNACFAGLVPMCCSVSKPARFKSDWRRKSRPNVRVITPRTN